MKLYSADPNLPNFARPEYVALEPDLTLVADEMGGTRSMHARSTTYIRKWSAEKIPNYNIRRVCESFFEGFGRTLSAAIGMLFAKAPGIEWNQSEAQMEPHAQNIDASGAKLPVFVKRFSEAALRDGLSIILVDHPSAPKVAKSEDNPDAEVTGAMAEKLNLRPIWSRYDRRQAINWLVETVDNVATLTQLTLVESATVRAGLFGTKDVVRYRDLRLSMAKDGTREATWTLRELVDGIGRTSADSFREVGRGTFVNKEGEAAPVLPIAIAYAGRTNGPMDASIPLLGVAWANLAHWQLSTSLRFNSEVAGFAQPTVIGELAKHPDTGKPIALEIGPLVSVQVAEGGDFKWSEPAGTGLERLAELVVEKLRQIAALGVSFMQSDTRAAETAEAKRLDSTAQNATLATAAQGIEDAVNLALEYHAWYLGIEKDGAPVLTISRDYESTTMDPATMLTYVTAIRDAGLPVRILLEAWMLGGRLPPDTDIEELELEMEAAKAAADEQKRLEMEEQAKRIQPPIDNAA